AEAALSLPVKLSVPPLRVIGAASRTRSARFVPLLSRVSVPPWLTVTLAVLANVPAPLSARVPPVRVVAPLWLAAPVRLSVPGPARVSGAVTLVPVRPPARAAELAIPRTVGPARLTAPLKVGALGPVLPSVGVPLSWTAFVIVNGV